VAIQAHKGRISRGGEWRLPDQPGGNGVGLQLRTQILRHEIRAENRRFS
jgi:hypothetical protein